MNRASDESLLEACLAGSEPAWRELVSRYRNLVYSVPVRYQLNPEDAADVFQQVWLALYSELPNLRHTGALRSWLVTVAAHRCYHLKRKALKNPASLEDEAEPAGVTDDWRQQAEKEQVFREAIRQLPERCQKLVRMLFYEDPPRPYAEVAQRLGLAEGSIGFIRGRCLAKLKAQLEKMGF